MRDLRDVARYVKRHLSGTPASELDRLATGYLEMRQALDPLLDKHAELKACTRRVLAALDSKPGDLGQAVRDLQACLDDRPTPPVIDPETYTRHSVLPGMDSGAS